MKCPVCGAAELIRDTRDIPYTYKGETTLLPSVTADFCPACDESITDRAETERVMCEMQAFNKQVNAAIVDLTACYPPEAGVTQVWLALWLIGRAQLLVCDQVQGAAPLPVAYHWHGHPELYRCIQQGEALLASAEQPERLFRISSPQCPLEPAEGAMVHARCEASPEHFQGALEYAFYLMVGGRKAVVHWYTPSPEAALPIPEAAGREPLEVRGFVREQAHPDKKRMLAVAVS